MGRHLRRAGIALPAVLAGGRRREAPDEDRFTLAVAAAETLERSDDPEPIGRVHLFGEFTVEQAERIGVALGMVPGAPAARHPGDAPALHALLTEEQGHPGPGAAVVLAADALRESSEAGALARDSGAVALWLGSAAERPPPPSRRPDRPELRLGAEGSALELAAELAAQLPGDLLVPSTTEASWTVGHAPPGPEVTARSEGAYVPWPRYLENLPSRWRFAADRCGRCGAITFPVRGSCRSCGAAEGLGRFELPRTGGTVLAVTTVHPGAQPTEFDWRVELLGAYDVALVELADGVRVTLQVTDAPPGALRAGDRVATRLRRLYPMEGEWRYGRKAMPL